jgi:hypothetical protein
LTRRIAAAAAGAGAASGSVVLFVFDPATSGLFPPCVFHALTGLHCPGCGSLRALHALLHGDVAQALAFNPLTTAALPLLLLGFVREARRIASGRDLAWRVPAWMIYGLLALLVVFGIARNLPAGQRLAPHDLAVHAPATAAGAGREPDVNEKTAVTSHSASVATHVPSPCWTAQPA